MRSCDFRGAHGRELERLRTWFPSCTSGYSMTCRSIRTALLVIATTLSAGACALTDEEAEELEEIDYQCGVLASGQSLAPNQSLSSCSGNAVFWHQGDGNLVVYDEVGWRWHSNTVGRSTSILAMQTDGNVVLYNTRGKAIWATWTQGNPGAWLAMQDDCNLVVYSADGEALAATWSFCR